MREYRTVHEASQAASTTHTILLEIFQDDRSRLEGAFRTAERCMNEALAIGSPFIVTDGRRSLIVAVRGEPLQIVAPNGGLHDADEQDFQMLIRSVW